MNLMNQPKKGGGNSSHQLFSSGDVKIPQLGAEEARQIVERWHTFCRASPQTGQAYQAKVGETFEAALQAASGIPEGLAVLLQSTPDIMCAMLSAYASGFLMGSLVGHNSPSQPKKGE